MPASAPGTLPADESYYFSLMLGSDKVLFLPTRTDVSRWIPPPSMGVTDDKSDHLAI